MVQSKTDLIADPTIAEVLAEFLDQERERLGDRTYRRYEEVIDLLTICLDRYAYAPLTGEDRARFDRLYDAEGEEHREFTEIFGPDEILPNIGEFLGYFVPHKVMAGKELLRASGTVTKKLAKWLAAEGYVEEDDADVAAERGAAAARDLPAADSLAQLLDRSVEEGATLKDEEEGYFAFTRAKPGKVWVESDAGLEFGPIRLPEQVAELCTIGWTFSGIIGRHGKSWYLIEVWNVYP